jgi:hypothetical protein
MRMKSGGSGSAVNQLINGNGNGGPAAGPTLAEVAEKLSELREHVDQTVARLNALCNRDTVASTNVDTFRCHECGEESRADQSGWTLRLCGDDELHPFCPSCDRRHVSGIGGGTRRTATEPSL